MSLLQTFLNVFNDLKKSDTWKIQLAIEINFFFSEENHEEHVMHSKSNKTEFMIIDKWQINFLNHFLKDIKVNQKHK